MGWEEDGYTVEELSFYFGDRRRDGDGELLEELAHELNGRRWTVGVLRARNTKVVFPTYTIQRQRRHDDPAVERRVLAEFRELVARLAEWTCEQERELELSMHGEPIGWIVRGEIDRDLVRFVDRWARELDVHVEALEARLSDVSACSQVGRVSVWVGDLRDDAALQRYLQERNGGREDKPMSHLARDLGVWFYDHDLLEGSWRSRCPIGQLLAGVSFGRSFVPQAIEAAHSRGIEAASTLIVLFDFDHSTADRPTLAAGKLAYIGTFAYDTATTALSESPPSSEPIPEKLATVVAPWRHYYPRLFTYRRASQGLLEQLEDRIGFALPASYRSFLLHFGNASATAGRLRVPVNDADWTHGLVEVDQFAGFSSDGMLGLDPHGRIPATLFPFATTPNGDHLCIGISRERTKQVWYWTHDFPRQARDQTDDGGPWIECLYFVADSFDAFLASIVLDPDDADDECARIVGAGQDAALERSRVIARSLLE